ncbi:hypothetical protein BDP27DRAFT_1432141 [Rhodocollybia butyracea]|uniref:Uncharacterized protein n=1 Tax=Rhodocollybia butyracea TaxID=206335 RepID=A0A9P5PB16_9AGAR|nr:hypothetical protein BDP27DRAFT_1432141 [Rhodocollybia butyracea]
MSSEEYTLLQQTLIGSFIVPIAVELFLYGIFLVLFSFSVYVVRKRVMPGILYVIATLIFFTLATISISLDLAWRSSDGPVLTGIPLLGGAVIIKQSTLNLEPGPYYIFFIAGLLSDAMMIHRCYRLWNSRKSVIIFPLFILIGIFITWIVLLVARLIVDPPGKPYYNAGSELADTTKSVYELYVLVTLVENLVLTGLMAGRVWWLDHKMKKILVGDKNKRRVSRSLLGPILQSGALTPISLILWFIVDSVGSPVLLGNFFLTPCALTQIMGIASTLIVVSIGLGVDSDSQSHMSDEENQSAILVLDSRELHPSTRNAMQVQDCPSTDTIQPFSLKYDDQQEADSAIFLGS